MQGMDAQRPIGELFSELAVQTGTLLKKEVELAKVELTGKARTASRNAMQVGAGGAVTLLGAGALLAGLILLLGTVIPLWLSAILCGVVVSAVGALVVRRGASSLRELDPVPRGTIQSLDETTQWARREVTQ